MASPTHQQLQEEYLSCIICKNVYTDPISLPCQHSFCRECFVQYSKQNKEATKKTSLQCPNCREFHHVAEPGKKVKGSWRVDDWVSPLKPLFIIQGMLDDFTRQGATALDHRTDHQENSAICLKHMTPINYYCRKCQTPVCSDCGFQDHGKCGDVIRIEVMQGHMKTEIDNSKENMTGQIKQKEIRMKTTMQALSTLDSLESLTKEKIRKVFEIIKQREKELYEELKTLTKKERKTLKSQLKSDEIDLQTLRQNVQFINNLKEDNVHQVCEMYQWLQSMTTMPDCAATQDHVVDIEFSGVVDGAQVMQLPNLRIRRSHVEQPEIKQDKVLVKHEDDMMAPYSYLCDVCVLDVDSTEYVVVTDRPNRSVKSVFIKNMVPHVTSLTLKCKPWAVTRLSNTQVAVTVPDINQIVLISVTPELIAQRVIQTQSRYYGITSLDESTLVVGCSDSSSLDILDSRGIVKRSIKPTGTLLKQPDFLCTTRDGNILVSSRGIKCIVCLSPSGDVLFKYSGEGEEGSLGWPCGVTTTATGCVLVADGDTNKVIQLSPTGEYVKDVDISHDYNDYYFPTGVSFHRDKLFVVQGERPLRVYRVD